MANTTQTPNMNLVVPTVSVDPSPDWANNVNGDLNVIDQHDHSSGKGVQISSDGINLTSDLPFNNNNATLVRSIRFQAQTSNLSSPDIGCLYQYSSGDLWYVNGAGNGVQITNGTSLAGTNGTISGLSSPASASYSSGSFTFQSAASTPANGSWGSISIGQVTASGYGVTLTANGSQAASYTLTLPAALPSVNSVLTCNSSGAISFGLKFATFTGTLSSLAGSNILTGINNLISISGFGTTGGGTTQSSFGSQFCDIFASFNSGTLQVSNGSSSHSNNYTVGVLYN